MIQFNIGAIRLKFQEAYKNKQYKTAIEFGEKLITAHNIENNTDNMEYAYDLLYLANSYCMVGYHGLSIPMYKRIINIYLDEYGETLELADYLSCLAKAYNMKGEHEIAITIHLKAHNLRTINFKTDDNSLFLSTYNLANAYVDTKRYGYAEAQFNKALLLCDKESKDYFDVLNSMCYLYEAKEEYNLAIDYLKKATNFIKKHIPDKPIYQIKQFYYSGLLYEKNNDFEKAFSSFKKAYKLMIEHNKNNNYQTTLLLNKLTEIASTLKEFKKAINYKATSIDISKNLIGNLHLTTVKDMKLLAELEYKHGSKAQATDLCLEIVMLSFDIFGVDSKEYYFAILDAFSLLFHSDDFQTASLLFINITNYSFSCETVSTDENDQSDLQGIVISEINNDDNLEESIEKFKNICIEQKSGKTMWRKFSLFFKNI